MKHFGKKLPALLPAILLGVFVPCFAHGQSAREAINALKKLKNKCEAGISYSDYPPALADAKLEIRRFLEGREAAQNPFLVAKMDAILEIYEEARLTWSVKFRKTNTPADRFHRGGLLALTDEQDMAIWSAFLAAYPTADKDIGAGGAVVGGQSASIDAMVRMIWSRAAKELAEAEYLLPGSGIKPTSRSTTDVPDSIEANHHASRSNGANGTPFLHHHGPVSSLTR